MTEAARGIKDCIAIQSSVLWQKGWLLENFVSQYTRVYCDLKAARGLALYCNTMRS